MTSGESKSPPQKYQMFLNNLDDLNFGKNPALLNERAKRKRIDKKPKILNSDQLKKKLGQDLLE